MATRQNKTQIRRTRTGCFTCRRRRLKCDEGKPICQACLRLGIACEGYRRVQFRNETSIVRQKSTISEARKWQTINAQARRASSGSTRVKNDDIVAGYSSASNLESDDFDRQTGHRLEVHPGRGNLTQTAHLDSNDSAISMESSGNSCDRVASSPPSFGVSNADSEDSDTFNDEGRHIFPHASASRHFSASDCSAHFNSQQLASHELPEAEAVTILANLAASPCQGSKERHTKIVDLVILHTINCSGTLASSEYEWDLAFQNTSASSSDTLSPATRNDVCLDNSPATSTVDSSVSIYEDATICSIRSSSLLSSLPPVFKDLIPEHQASPVFRGALLALALSEAASNDKRSPPTYRGLSKAISYYSDAVMEFSREGPDKHSATAPVKRLSILLLFTYYETQWGSFIRGLAHMYSADSVIENCFDEIRSTPFGEELICRWHSLRALYTYQCSAFGSDKYLEHFQRSPLKTQLNSLLRASSNRNDYLMKILSECSRFCTLIMFERAIGTSNTSSKYRNCQQQFKLLKKDGPGERVYESGSQSTLLASLDGCRSDLDDWHQHLPLSDLPVESFTSLSVDSHSLPGLSILPLRFNSHTSAMTYARYACAQLYCCRSSIDRCTGVSRGEIGGVSSRDYRNRQPPINPWVHLILRIARSLSIEECAKMNIYEIGILSILGVAAQYCMDIDVLVWIGNFVAQIQATGVYQEGCVPIHIIRRTIKRYRSELERKNRAIFYEYTGFCSSEERVDLYRAKSIVGAVLFGLDMTTGELFTEYVGPDEDMRYT